MTASAREAQARKIVAQRSNGVCELCDQARATHCHHRWLKSQGGPWCPANLIHLDASCHDRIHKNPKDAEVHGWILPRPPLGQSGEGLYLPQRVHVDLALWGHARLTSDGMILQRY